MTDLPPIPSDDELSAHLDGEAGAHVADAIAADPTVAARLDALAAARDAVAAPVEPLDAGVVDRLVATALVAADDPASAAPIAPVAPIRRRPRPFVPVWAAAAIIGVLLVAGLGLIFTGRDDGSDPVASSDKGGTLAAEESSGAASAASTTVAPTSGAAADGATTTTRADGLAPRTDTPWTGPVVALGSFADDDAFRSALKAAFPTDAKTATTSATDGADLGRCAGLIADVFDLQGQPSHVGTATIRGTDVLVIEFPASATTTGERRPLITAVEPVGCAPVVTFVR